MQKQLVTDNTLMYLYRYESNLFTDILNILQWRHKDDLISSAYDQTYKVQILQLLAKSTTCLHYVVVVLSLPLAVIVFLQGIEFPYI